MSKNVSPKEKVGKIAHDLLNKTEAPVKVHELQDAMTEDYMKNLRQCIDSAYTRYPGSFYVVVETKKERIMDNVLRNYFFARQSCPTPTWDQTLWRYNRVKGAIEYVWTIPSKDTCALYMQNAPFIADEEKQLLDFIIKFENGTLLKLAKKWNGEKEDSILLAN